MSLTMKKKFDSTKNQAHEKLSDLNESAAFFHSLFDKSPEAIFVTDNLGTFLQANSAAGELLDLPPDKIIGHRIVEFTSEEFIADTNKKWNEFLTGNLTEGFFYLKQSDGKSITVDYSAKAYFLPFCHLLTLHKAEEIEFPKRTKKSFIEKFNEINVEIGVSSILSIADKRGKITYINDKFCEISKFSREELLGQDHRITNSKFHPKGFFREMMKTLARGETWHGEIRNRTKDGSPYWVETTIVALMDDKGKPYQYVAVRKDITERKQAEKALIESEERFRTLADTAPVLIWMSGKDKISNYYNKSWTEFTGRVFEERIGKGWEECVHPDDLDRCLEIYATNFDARKQFEMEYRLRRANGEYGWILDRGVPRYTHDGDFLGYIGSGTDITELKQYEENTRQNEQRLRGLIDNLFSFVGLLTPDGTLVEINRTALDVANLKPSDVLGKKFADTYWWSWTEDVQEHLCEAIVRAAQGETLRYDVVIRVGKNQFITIDFQIAPVFAESGEVIYLVPSGIDVTERLQLEMELHQSAQMSLAGEFAAGLAHEIKNPLTGIQGAIDILIQRQKSDGSERHILENVRGEIVRIDETVRLLLDRARPRLMRFIRASLRETLRRAVQLAVHQAAARQLKDKIKVEWDLPDKSFMLFHDTAQVEDAVLNLIINAMDAIGEQKGRIVICLFKTQTIDGEEAVIKVSDTGGGISETDLAKIFTPFYTTKKTGTGLGLAAVKRIAAAHRGYCDVKSVVGRGSTFTIHLPIDV